MKIEKQIGKEIMGECYGITVMATGRKVRGKKDDVHYFDVGYTKVAFNPEEIRDICLAVCDDYMKRTDKAVVQLRYMKRSDWAEEFQMFDDRNKKMEII